MGVTLGASFILKSTELPASRDCFSSSSRRASASVTIVRNLSIWKGRPLMPTRSWRKRTGPGVLSRMVMAIARNSGEASTRISVLATMSNAGLAKSLVPS